MAAIGRGNDDSSTDHPPTPSQPQLKIYEANVLRPVTLRQVLNADHCALSNLFKIDGRKFQSIKVVATIREEIVRERYISYKLDDGTIDSARPVYAMFLPKDSYEYDSLMPTWTGDLPCLRDISLVGRIDRFKTGDRKRFIRIESLHPVTDPHETFHHVLEVMTTELMYTRSLPPEMQAISAEQHARRQTVSQSGEEPEGNSDEDNIAQQDHPTNTPAPQRVQRPSRRDSPPAQPVTAPQTPTKASSSRRPLSPLAPELEFLSLNSPPSTPRASPSRSAASTRTSTTGNKPTASGNAAARPTVTPAASFNRVSISTPQASSSRSGVSTSASVIGRNPLRDADAAVRPTITPVAIPIRASSPTPQQSDWSSAATNSISTTRREPNSYRNTATRPNTTPVASPGRVPILTQTATADLSTSDPATTTNTNRGPRLSMRDPLSHLSSLQRSILLKIMDDVAAGISEDVYIIDIVQHIKQTRSESVTSATIRQALEFLVEADLIEQTTDEFDYFKAKDSKGKRRAYDLPRE